MNKKMFESFQKHFSKTLDPFDSDHSLAISICLVAYTIFAGRNSLVCVIHSICVCGRIRQVS